MVDYFQGATFEKNGHVRRDAYRGMDDVVQTKVTMKHKIPLSELIEYVTEHARDVSFDQIMLNWATVSWSDVATAEEIAAWKQRQADNAARLEAWERRKLAELVEKYGIPDHTDGAGRG